MFLNFILCSKMFEEHSQIFPGGLCWEWGGDDPKCKPGKSLITRAGPGAGAARTGAMLSLITCLCLFVCGEIVLHIFAEHRNSKKRGRIMIWAFFLCSFLPWQQQGTAVLTSNYTNYYKRQSQIYMQILFLPVNGALQRDSLKERIQ